MIDWRHRTAVMVVAGTLVAASSAQTPTFRPVTDAVLKNPSPNDWLAWRGTTRSQGYSALKQINRDNVGHLQMAWAWAMEQGPVQVAPLAHDGVVYLGNPGGTVHALDGATGDLLWEYKPETPPGGRPPAGNVRGIAIYEDKIYVNVPDGRVVALDARTGKLVWSTQAKGPQGFRFSTAPLVARGKVISVMVGCEKYVEEKCAIVAHDARTGKESWRTPIIPSPGTPGSESWGDVPHLYRAGIDMWMPGSYDPDLNLVYWSTSQPKPWTRAARGSDADALYSNSTLAIDPDSGKIVWYRQTLPGETHDLDEVFENIVVETKTGKSLFKMGKIGILWEMDPATGALRRGTDMGYQNVADLDPKTFKVTYRPGMLPKLDVPITHCPGTLGVRNWPSIAWSPDTQALYVPMLLACSTITHTAVEKVPGGGGVGMRAPAKYFPHPNEHGNNGALTALSTEGKVLWQHKQRTPFTSAGVTTAGGLLFIADYDRYVHAFDITTGKSVWKARLATTGHGFPMTYMAGGRQFVAMPTGAGASYIESKGLDLMPELPLPRPNNALVVFALPN